MAEQIEQRVNRLESLMAQFITISQENNAELRESIQETNASIQETNASIQETNHSIARLTEQVQDLGVRVDNVTHQVADLVSVLRPQERGEQHIPPRDPGEEHKNLSSISTEKVGEEQT
jgi:chromosome segregation ATPase